MISEWWMKSQAQDDGKSTRILYVVVVVVVVAIARNKVRTLFFCVVGSFKYVKSL